MFLDGKRVTHLPAVFPVFTQKCPSGALVAVGMRHTHHRVDGSDEGDPLCACHHRQVPSCRESHHSNPVRVDAILRGMFPYILDGSLQVINHIRMLMPLKDESRMRDVRHNALHAIFQHKSRDAIRLKPTRHLAPLCLHVMPAIRTARADDDAVRGGLCYVWCQRDRLCLGLRPFPDMYWFLTEGKLPKTGRYDRQPRSHGCKDTNNL